MADLDEFKERLADLMKGPWTAKGKLARKRLAPKSKLLPLVKSDEALDLSTIENHLVPEDTNRQAELQGTLRWHGDQLVTGKEMEVRDSLDYALVYLMLLELAIETGYLPLDVVRLPARQELVSLLWSKGAQQFIRYYDYVGIEYLAQRVGIRGFRTFAPPAPNPEASTRFAVFLSQFSDWINDEHLREWLGFLDDYVKYQGEQNDFRVFLQQGTDSSSKRFQRLSYGIDRFLLSLSDLFGILEEGERARFGLFYTYWMAKFFGYKLTDVGYVRNNEPSWATVTAASPVFVLSTLQEDQRDYYRKSLQNKISCIEEVWNATRKLVAQSADVKLATSSEQERREVPLS